LGKEALATTHLVSDALIVAQIENSTVGGLHQLFKTEPISKV
jgi:hypothetical protein